MIGLRIEGTYHWGYWIRVPGTSKAQPSIPVPPPTTLIGALSFPLVRKGLIEYKGEVAGEFITESSSDKGNREVDFKSSAFLIEGMVYACSAFLTEMATYWEDINRYNTLLFQRLTKSTDEEKQAGGRRYLPRYLTGAITTGKVYYPNGGLIIAYALDERLLKATLSPSWRSRLEEASWSITRIGSKESIFSVRKVEIIPSLKEAKGAVKTKFYFQSDAGEVDEGQVFYKESFWRGGWGRHIPPVFLEYVIPGNRTPIKSEPVKVKIIDIAYEFGSEEILLVGKR